jgi:hypothetical protein
VPGTKLVAGVYDIAGNLWLEYKMRLMLFSMTKALYYLNVSTGLFISPSGISELDCATTNTDTAERSISIGRESIQVVCTRSLGVLAGSIARG